MSEQLMSERLSRFESFLPMISSKSENFDFPAKVTRGEIKWKFVPGAREDVNFFVNQARWFSHLVPSWKQCIIDDHRARLGVIVDTFCAFYNGLDNDEFEDAKDILMKVFHAFQTNRWVGDFLRPDQLQVAQQNRWYLSSQLTDYANTFFTTIEDFRVESDTMDFYLNSPVFQQDLNNANLVDSPTGTGKTRISIVANLAQFSWSNDELPFAARKLAIFVRTRSQTQAFLKEAARLDLTVGSPISVGLGCQAHNEANQKFMDDLVAWSSFIHGGINSVTPKPMKAVPLELYNIAIQSEDDSLKDFAVKVKVFYKATQGRTQDVSKSLPHDVKVFFNGFNKESASYQQLVKYLCETPEKCTRCFSNISFMKKQVKDEPELLDDELNDLIKNLDHWKFFQNTFSKNADINHMARTYQDTYGFCGRGDSVKNLSGVDVVIFTYNWLLDFGISRNQTTRILQNKDQLDANTAVICDEGHFLFGYNKSQQFDFGDTMRHVSRLVGWKLKFQEPEYKISGLGKVENPLATKEFKTLDVRDAEEHLEKSVGNITHSTLKALKGILRLQSTFGLMPNNGDSPRILYTLLTNENSGGHPKDLYTSLKGIEFPATETSLQKIFETTKAYIRHWQSISALVTMMANEKQSAIETAIIKGEKPSDRWLGNVHSTWVGAGKKNPGKVCNALIHIASEPYTDIAKAIEYILNFLVIVQENLYAEAANLTTRRVLAITASSASPEVYGIGDILKPRFLDELPQEQAVKELAPFLEQLKPVLFKVPKDVFKEPLKIAKDTVSLSSTMKVNRPLIQTALRPYGYVTILTGTPPDLNLWKSKSGFKYFTTSKYAVPFQPFTFEFVNDYELKYETRSPALYQKIANDIMKRTTEQNTLVCYPSGLILKNIAEHFPKQYTNSILLENHAMTLEQIQQYVEKTKTGSVHVVCGGKFVEGIELSDDNGSSLIKQVIIVGVPFNPPSEEQNQINKYYEDVYGWDKWDCMRQFMYAPVYMKIRQCIGRSVRNLNDRAKVVFLDSRYANSKMLRQALKLF